MEKKVTVQLDTFEKFDLAYQKFCEWVVTWVVGLFITASMMYVTGNVLGRYFFRYSIPGMISYVGLMLVPITFFSMANGWYKGAIIRVNILPPRLKGSVAWWFDFIIYLLGFIAFGVIMLLGAVVSLIGSYNTGELAGGVGYSSPMWPWKIPMILGLGMFGFRIALDLIMMIRTKKTLKWSR